MCIRAGPRSSHCQPLSAELAFPGDVVLSPVVLVRREADCHIALVALRCESREDEPDSGDASRVQGEGFGRAGHRPVLLQLHVFRRLR